MKLTEFKNIEPVTADQINERIKMGLSECWRIVGGYIRYGMDELVGNSEQFIHNKKATEE
jgi:hypothetical protein